MTTKFFAASAAALIALTAAGSAFADSRDAEIQALQQRAAAAFDGPVFITPVAPELDPALDARDREIAAVQAGAAGTTGSVIATNDSGLAGTPAQLDPALDSRDREIADLQARAFGG